MERDDWITANATFRGNYSSSYETRVNFFPARGDGWNFMDNCTCPVGDNCKHAAALLIYLTEKLETVAGPGADKSQLLDVELSSWISQISATPDLPGSEVKKKSERRFLAYCIESPRHSYNPGLTLNLHVGRTLKSGQVKIDLHANANADPVRPPGYMTDEDLLPCTLFHQLSRGYYQYGGIELEGSGAGRLLEQILKTGRLFYVSDERNFQPVLEGDAINPQPIWKTESDGSARPAFEKPFSNESLLISTAPSYLMAPAGDSETMTLHSLDTQKHSLDFISAWMNGPTLSPRQLATAATQLQKKAPALPAPTPVKTKSLKKSKPVPRLHLSRQNPFSHGGHHLSGQPEPIVAELAFLYHGHPFTPDLADPPPKSGTFIASKKDTVYKISRHTQEERKYIFQLVDEYGILPASAIDGSVNPQHASAFLPREAPSGWDAAMADFIVNAVPILREEGWEITVDTSAELSVHTIGSEELDTGLTELPDHGIDWFQFTASYLTPEGEKQPLLPLLSSYLQQLDFDLIDQSLEFLSEDDQTLLKDPETPNSFLAFPTLRLLRLAKTLHDLFGHGSPEEPLHRLQAADLADSLEMDGSQTLKDLAQLGSKLKNFTTLPKPAPPKSVLADLRDYQLDGFHWMQFLARHALHGILADDMGLGKTLQALTHLQAEVSGRRTKKRPSLVLAPTSVVGNWQNEAKKFTPKLKTLLLHGPERKEHFKEISKNHLVITSYALLVRDFEDLKEHDFHLIILDEAQYIKNPAAKMSQLVCKLSAAHRISLSGTPLENHLGELWSQMRFLMPGLLGSSEAFRKHFRTPIEKHGDTTAQRSLNARVAPLILRRTKDQVATELPPKTEILHTIPLNPAQVDVYETVRAAMDSRIRDAIADKGLAKSQIIVLDALLKLRQICCHPQLLKLAAAQKIEHSAKLDFLTGDLLPTLLEEGRKMLIFSTFTTMLALIEEHLKKEKIPFSKITGSTKDRQKQVEQFQASETPIFLISLKAGGTGLNLTAADTVIHYDPWWNPAAENQATDRAYRIGQDKPVFVHKLITEGSIEERIVQLQSQKAKLVEALLSEKTNKLQLDQETLGSLLAPIEV